MFAVVAVAGYIISGVALVGLVRGRVRWARIYTRRRSALALFAGLAVLGFAGSLAPTPPHSSTQAATHASSPHSATPQPASASPASRPTQTPAPSRPSPSRVAAAKPPNFGSQDSVKRHIDKVSMLGPLDWEDRPLMDGTPRALGRLGTAQDPIVGVIGQPDAIKIIDVTAVFNGTNESDNLPWATILIKSAQDFAAQEAGQWVADLLTAANNAGSTLPDLKQSRTFKGHRLLYESFANLNTVVLTLNA